MHSLYRTVSLLALILAPHAGCGLHFTETQSPTAAVTLSDVSKQLSSLIGLNPIDLFKQTALPGTVINIENGVLTTVICSQKESIGNATGEADSAFPEIHINGLTHEQFVQKYDLAVAQHNKVLSDQLSSWHDKSLYANVTAISININNAFVKSITETTVEKAKNSMRDPVCKTKIYNPPATNVQGIIMEVLVADVSYSVTFADVKQSEQNSKTLDLLATELRLTKINASNVLLKGNQLFIGAHVAPAFQ